MQVRIAALMPYLSMNLQISDIKRLEFISNTDKCYLFADYLKSILPSELTRVRSYDSYDDVSLDYTDPGFVGDSKGYTPLVHYYRKIQKNGIHQVNYLDSLFMLHPNKQVCLLY